MRDAAGRSSFMQQVLHAVALMARDRSGWADTPWALLRKLDPEHHHQVFISVKDQALEVTTQGLDPYSPTRDF